MKVLVVEDEKFIAKPIEQLLKKNHFSVDLASDGEMGLEYGLCQIYDAIILDIMLPKKNGFEVLEALRKHGIQTPILMLTARHQLEDRVRGLDGGADDYLPKPFANQELLARLRAMLRRKDHYHQDGVLQFADLRLNPHQLTLKESQILELLFQNKARVTTKEAIIERLWGFDSNAESSHVDYHVSLLRKKIRQLNAEVSIKTIRGLGYCLKVETS